MSKVRALIPPSKRVLPLQAPPPSWQLFELKRLCLEGLHVPMFKNPALLRRALVHHTAREKACKYGDLSPLLIYGENFATAILAKKIARLKPAKLEMTVNAHSTLQRRGEAAKRMGLQHAVSFNAERRGFPGESDLLGQVYGAVTAAILLDHGPLVAEEFVERTLIKNKNMNIPPTPEKAPLNTFKALEAELTFWRQQVKKRRGFLPDLPGGKIVVEEVRAIHSEVQQYWRLRLEILDVCLGRGDGPSKELAKRNALLAGLLTMSTEIESFEKRTGRFGEPMKMGALQALKFLQKFNVIEELTLKGSVVRVDGMDFDDVESALKWLRSFMQRSAAPKRPYQLHLDLDKRRMMKLIRVEDVEEVCRLVQIANEGNGSAMLEVNNMIAFGEKVLDLFCAEEAFWGCGAYEDMAVRKKEVGVMRNLQQALWLRGQRAQRLGFLPTEKLLEIDQKSEGEEILEYAMSCGMRLTVGILMDRRDYSFVRELLFHITYDTK